jgi:hypothetical protein
MGVRLGPPGTEKYALSGCILFGPGTGVPTPDGGATLMLFARLARDGAALLLQELSGFDKFPDTSVAAAWGAATFLLCTQARNYHFPYFRVRLAGRLRATSALRQPLPSCLPLCSTGRACADGLVGILHESSRSLTFPKICRYQQ